MSEPERTSGRVSEKVEKGGYKFRISMYSWKGHDMIEFEQRALAKESRPESRPAPASESRPPKRREALNFLAKVAVRREEPAFACAHTNRIHVAECRMSESYRERGAD